MEIIPRPATVTRLLVCLTLLLIAASAAVDVSKYVFGHGGLLGLVPLFQLHQEANIPTWFASALLLFASLLLAGIAKLTARAAHPHHRRWALLAVVFLLLSLDETAQIHDAVGDRLHGALRTTGAFFYAWVIPAGAVVVLLGAGYWRFLMALPGRTRWLMVIAAAVYVGGALGMEMVAAVHDEIHGYDNGVTAALATVEEAMEMFGVVIFIHALMTYTRSLVDADASVVSARQTAVPPRTPPPPPSFLQSRAPEPVPSGESAQLFQKHQLAADRGE